MVITEKERDEIIRWDGSKRGWYEVYYLKWNDPASRTAFWVRYTMTSPTPAKGDPYCELWGIFFDVDRPERNFAVKDRFRRELFHWDRDRFHIGVSEAELAFRSAHGKIADKKTGHELEWDLRFDSDTPSFHHFPHERMYGGRFPKTKVLSPHQFCKFSGEVVADGRRISFSDAPGQQTHIWGTKHALRWAWGHCNLFEEDKGAIWEGLDSQIKIGPFPSPRLKMFYLRYKGREYLFNGLVKLFSNASKWELGRWSFSAGCKDLRMTGAVACLDDEMVAVTYTDPDGEKLWCNNSKVATIKIDLFEPGGDKIGELNSDHGSAAEFVDRRIYDRVPVRI